MSVDDYLRRKADSGKAHLTLIDPDEQSPSTAGAMARQAERAGTDGIMIGGSTAEDREVVHRTVEAVKDACDLPAILFPGGVQGLSDRADAIFYISLLNSSDPYFITGAHAASAHRIRELGLEVIPVGYIVVEPGQTVGRLGKANLIPQEDPGLASSYALAAQFMGMRYVYLEAGSGASHHVPEDMISRTKESISIPLIVGGGIRTVDDAERVAGSGADILVQGTVLEEDGGASRNLARVIEKLRLGGGA